MQTWGARGCGRPRNMCPGIHRRSEQDQCGIQGIAEFSLSPPQGHQLNGQRRATRADGCLPEGSPGGHFGLGHERVGEWGHL